VEHLIGFVFFSIENSILTFVASKLLAKRFSVASIYSVFIAIAVFRILLRYLLLGSEIMFFEFIISLTLLLSALIFCYRGEIKKKISLFIIYCAITMCCEIIVGISVSFAYGARLTLDDPVALYTAFALHKLVLFILAFLFLRIRERDFYIKDWLRYFPVPIGIFVSFIWIFGPVIDSRGNFEQSIVLGLLGFLTCIFMIGYVQYKEKQRRTAEMLRMSLKHKWEERHHLEDQEAVMKFRNIVSHDMPHHFETVLSMKTVEEIHAYLEPIRKLADYRMKGTGNDHIDCILWPKQRRAEEKGISFNVTGVLPDEMDFLQRYDIVAIVGNALSNALDACDKIEGGGAFINVSFNLVKHLTIQIDNPYVEEPVAAKRGWFKSLKKEPGHGFGMESIKEAVDRYSGHMETVIENGIFSLRILLQQIKPPELCPITVPIGSEATIRSMEDSLRKYNGKVDHVVENGVSSFRISLKPPKRKRSKDKE
jgi:hypothetical protein